MKKLFVAAFVAVLMAVAAQAEKKYNVYAVGFYNLENLFDTCHDEGKKDYDFLPAGKYKWNGMKYSHKLHNMATVLAKMGTDMLPYGCAVIGVSEVENAKVLTDLCAQKELAERGMQFAHIEGPDRRGIDCAFIYNPQLFKMESLNLYPYVPEEEKDSAFHTRGFLTMKGEIAGEKVALIVCHWPSRFSGSYYREIAGKQVRHLKDSLMAAEPELKVMVMGDMNDDPTDRSMHEQLGAKAEIEEVGDGDMYNPWYNILAKQGKGTLRYDGKWNLFDQIVLSPNMLDKKGKKNYKSLTYLRNKIQDFPFLFQTEGKYKGNPKRTTAGGVWLDGYSDHLPVCVYLIKEMK